MKTLTTHDKRSSRRIMMQCVTHRARDNVTTHTHRLTCLTTEWMDLTLWLTHTMYHVSWHFVWLGEHLTKLSVCINCKRMKIYNHLKYIYIFLKMQIIWEGKDALCHSDMYDTGQKQYGQATCCSESVYYYAMMERRKLFTQLSAMHQDHVGWMKHRCCKQRRLRGLIEGMQWLYGKVNQAEMIQGGNKKIIQIQISGIKASQTQFTVSLWLTWVQDRYFFMHLFTFTVCAVCLHLH